MGGAVSSGRNNNHLIDNLVDNDYIHTIMVERVFRAIDRAEYMLQEYRCEAYKDQAWRHQHYHLSAPCIYSEALEGLRLRPGLSFLNLGSGTGYLSTMAGLILGSNGVNHGVEYHEDVIKYAYTKLEEFKKYSGAIDEFDFCEPQFMQGNCLALALTRRYDRIYVGASCPEQYDDFLKSFLKVGGIMIMPFRDSLMQVLRVSESSYHVCPLIPVTFAMLILPKTNNPEPQELLDIQPLSLQQMCRNKIRNILRENVNEDVPNIKFHRSKMFSHLKRYHKIHDKDMADFEYTSLVNRQSCDEDDKFPEAKKKKRCDDKTVRRRRRRDNSDSGDSSSSDMETNENAEEHLLRPTLNYFASPSFIFDWNINLSEHSDEEEVEEEEEEQQQSNEFRDVLCSDENSCNSCTDEGESEEDHPVRRMIESPYTPLMREKIDELPLPGMLKEFLNYNRV
ncbi:PREDICTED: protein-L-isoaspartate O-methyltransferase domain-containing protein 1-like isoform X2 [Nicrophorus vespilloides]|nr:PREDICTED: protein-L-isoaspartate O-methyltransferase domain-containing protein 1-like isoform X2 [Nicrophorus vespilloides]